jgi:hypothetical protein
MVRGGEFDNMIDRIEKSASMSALRAFNLRLLYGNSANYESRWITGDVDFY